MSAPGLAESLVIRLPPASSQEATSSATAFASGGAVAREPSGGSATTLSDSSLQRGAMVEVCGDAVCAVQVRPRTSSCASSPDTPSSLFVLLLFRTSV